MNTVFVTVFYLWTLTIGLISGTSTDVEQAYKDENLVPDILSVGPKSLLNVEYGDKTVDLGNELLPKEVANAPTVSYSDVDPEALYTLIMTDPDAPSRSNPIRREWGHWIVVNIPGLQLEKGKVLSEYIGARPPKNTGLHRYALLLYQQPGQVTFSEPYRSATDYTRAGFKVKDFASKYDLGNPVAGNYFQAKYDGSY